jgi:uncharacterized protein (TIGR02145 family)
MKKLVLLSFVIVTTSINGQDLLMQSNKDSVNHQNESDSMTMNAKLVDVSRKFENNAETAKNYALINITVKEDKMCFKPVKIYFNNSLICEYDVIVDMNFSYKVYNNGKIVINSQLGDLEITRVTSIINVDFGISYYLEIAFSDKKKQGVITKLKETNIPDEVLPSGTVTDIEGNVYNTIIIGEQTWMKENLKVTKFNDGNAINLVTDNVAWSKYEAPAYCWYNNDSTNKDIYGALYNRLTISEKVCPDGWHVPSDNNWFKLEMYLGVGGVDVTFAWLESAPYSWIGVEEGGKLKENSHYWNNPNKSATNTSGFSGRPGGVRGIDGKFGYLGHSGVWWTASDKMVTLRLVHLYRLLQFDHSDIWRSYSDRNSFGLSIRCLKD